MTFKKMAFALLMTSLTVAGCGGGGGGGGSGTAAPLVEQAPVIATINAADAMAKFLGTDQITSGLTSNDGSLGTADLIVRTEESYPFIANGSVQQTSLTKVIQFQQIDENGRLRNQSLWKLHFDANMKPIGMAVGNEFSNYRECLSITEKNDLPVSTNSSGVFFAGVQTTNYAETFRSGTYAHYCDPTSTTVANVE